MIAGKFAFQGLSEYLTWEKIKRLDYSFPEGFDEEAKDLVQKLLVRLSVLPHQPHVLTCCVGSRSDPTFGCRGAWKLE